MWPRVVEVTIGCWLAMSPFIFHHPPEKTLWWVNDFACAVAVMAFALLSWVQPLRHIHLLSCVVAVWLIASGYLHGQPVPPAVQNNVLVGWLLGMFAILPSPAELPPQSWQEFSAQHPSD
jgi:hypothetical protein